MQEIFFPEDEFRNPDWDPKIKNPKWSTDFNPENNLGLVCPCGCGTKYEPTFIRHLDMARRTSRVEFPIKTGYRCPEYDRSIDDQFPKLKEHDSDILPCAGRLAHIRGLAVDIKITSDDHWAAVLYGLLSAGFDRIGIGPDFIHVDRDLSRARRMAWLCCDRKFKTLHITPKALFGMIEHRILQGKTSILDIGLDYIVTDRGRNTWGIRHRPESTAKPPRKQQDSQFQIDLSKPLDEQIAAAQERQKQFELGKMGTGE